MDMRFGTPGRQPQKRSSTMSITLNRTLDVLASWIVVALGLALAGATAAVGA